MDFEKVFGNEDRGVQKVVESGERETSFGSNLTRSELRIKRGISEIKEECGELRDRDEALTCLRLAQDFDKNVTEAMTDSLQRR